MKEATFIAVQHMDDKPVGLRQAIAHCRHGNHENSIYLVDTAEFRRIPGSPFAYWTTARVRSAFDKFPRLESSGRTARFGASTKDDFRWLRAWWELAGEARSVGWFPLAKGGVVSRYYASLPLVLDWRQDGKAIKEAVARYRKDHGWSPHWKAELHGSDYYFRPGITWPRRSDGLSFRPLAPGCIFGDKGPAIFVERDSFEMLACLNGLVNSRPFERLLQLQVARVDLAKSFEVGIVKEVPVPDLSTAPARRLGDLALRCFYLKRDLHGHVETTEAFLCPLALRFGPLALNQSLAAWETHSSKSLAAIESAQAEINEVALSLYELSDSDLGFDASNMELATPNSEEADDDDEGEPIGGVDLVAGLLSWAVGCLFGRFDVRRVLDPSSAPQLQGPFEPIPACSPGMLVGPDGLLATRDRIVSEEWLRARPNAITLPPDGSVTRPTIPDSDYPIVVDWDGILVDDPEHDDDVVRRVREVLHVVWGDGADGIEQEACEMLGVKELRDWFRNPRSFWDDHIKRYSKSRRKAPIYWLLQSSKRSFAMWIYYHRLDGDMLAKALTTYVEPKVRREETRLDELKAAFEAQQPTGAAARKAERDIERQEALVSELMEFRAAFDRATKLGLQPDLDDGVVLNIAPLHELVPWKVARQYWDELRAGKYEWSTVSKQLRTKGMVG